MKPGDTENGEERKGGATTTQIHEARRGQGRRGGDAGAAGEGRGEDAGGRTEWSAERVGGGGGASERVMARRIQSRVYNPHVKRSRNKNHV